MVSLEYPWAAVGHAKSGNEHVLSASVNVPESRGGVSGCELFREFPVTVTGEHQPPKKPKLTEPQTGVPKNLRAELLVKIHEFFGRKALSEPQREDRTGAGAAKQVERVSEPKFEVPLKFGQICSSRKSKIAATIETQNAERLGTFVHYVLDPIE